MRGKRRLDVVALLAELEHGPLIGRRAVVPAVVVGDALAALRALVREVRHDEVVSHVLNRRAQLLGQLDVQVIANLRVGQLLPARLALRRGFLALVPLRVLSLLLLDARDPILRDAGEVVAVKVRKLSRRRNVVVLVPQVKLVVQVTQRENDPLLLRLPEHLEVPLAQLVALGRLLLLGVAVEDVVLALEWGARPDETRGEPALLHVLQVSDENLVVAVGAKRAALAGGHLDAGRPEVFDRVEVGEVHAAGVGRRALAAVLLDVDAQEAHVHALNLLEEQENLGSVRERLGVLLVLEHAHEIGLGFQLLFHGGHDANGETLRVGYLVDGLAEELGPLLPFATQNLAKALLEEERELCLGQNGGGELRARALGRGRALLLLELREDALRARERSLAALVAPPVEEHANLVVPAVAVVALHPGFLEVVVVLLLGEDVLGPLLAFDLHVPLDRVVAPVAPGILANLAARRGWRDVVIHLSALDPTHARVAVQRRGLKREPLHAAALARALRRARDGLLSLRVATPGAHRLTLRHRVSRL